MNGFRLTGIRPRDIETALAAHHRALLARIVGYSLLEGWIVLSIILYVFAGAFWLPVVWVQMRMRDLATAAVINDRSLKTRRAPETE